ncbi:hypothetical protein SKAU_G00164060 [Synaphobranchus kaupii]|uniref:Uncharacterized protein n=1 Tax=Synaphobranchus kaupii TaxID=118154 RepID=A0A9Q1IZ60_SYNKA|nr:hypothetical protein SKAU_G00164060 [Synaphobranchus kaupii]
MAWTVSMVHQSVSKVREPSCSSVLLTQTASPIHTGTFLQTLLSPLLLEENCRTGVSSSMRHDLIGHLPALQSSNGVLSKQGGPFRLEQEVQLELNGFSCAPCCL